MMSQPFDLHLILSSFVSSLSGLVDYILSSKPAQLAVGLNLAALCLFLVFSDRPQIDHKPCTEHKRGGSSVYPPGMQFDVVQKKWARRGMEPPFHRMAPAS
jgi:hypothetical protein